MLQGFSGKLVSPRQAAALLGVNRETIYRLCARSELPNVRIGSVLRIDLRVPGQAPTLVREPLRAERGGKRAFTFAAPSSRSALVLHGSVPGFEVVLEDAVDSSSGE